ncbi:hypothetical protein [Chengkuizengella marina]|uniref:Uncharacterized protein n=1 Tax=Chengkuizengella marina TaxID=2507566 RepID=A0A6N9Q2A7_9BACL|nr:hypothetical protein [Chengkuizengella marina]NBI28654.1 hypothetical protein [Chengkuizengella marina]
MSIFWFFLFSSIEYMAFFFLMFRLFRFQPSYYVPQIVFSISLLLFVSTSMRYGFELSEFSAIAQLILICLLIWQLFNIHVFYAFVMGVSSYVFFGLIQSVIALIYHLDIEFINSDAYVGQTLTSIVALVIGELIKKYNKGFSFIPEIYSPRKIKFKFPYLVTIIASIVIVTVSTYYQQKYHEDKLLYISLLLLITLMSFLFISLHRENTTDD